MESIGSETTGQKPTDMTWAAAMIDGEGCFNYHNGFIRIAVETVSREIIEKLYELFGGKCNQLNRRTNSGRAVFRWYVGGQAAARVSALIHKHLIDKQKQAEILMKIMYYPARSETRKILEEKLKKLKRRM